MIFVSPSLPTIVPDGCDIAPKRGDIFLVGMDAKCRKEDLGKSPAAIVADVDDHICGIGVAYDRDERSAYSDLDLAVTRGLSFA